MKRMNFKNTLSAALLICGAIVATSALAQAQGGYGRGSGGMMNGYGTGTGWMGSGYGGFLLPLLLVVVIAALVVWIIAKKKK